jgi:hypothetical protein
MSRPQDALALGAAFSESLGMGLPNEPVTLNLEQLGELNRNLANMSHDVRNSLSLIVAATELIRQKPAMAEKMLPRVAEQPAKISETIDKFRAEFERACGITRP